MTESLSDWSDPDVTSRAFFELVGTLKIPQTQTVTELTSKVESRLENLDPHEIVISECNFIRAVLLPSTTFIHEALLIAAQHSHQCSQKDTPQRLLIAYKDIAPLVNARLFMELQQKVPSYREQVGDFAAAIIFPHDFRGRMIAAVGNAQTVGIPYVTLRTSIVKGISFLEQCDTQ